MKPKKAASKSTKATTSKTGGQRVVSQAGTEVQAFSLEPVFAALRKRYPTARQPEAAGICRAISTAAWSPTSSRTTARRIGRAGRRHAGVRAHAQARHRQRARVQPDDQGQWLGIAAHGAADRQRRHAVPGGFGEHGAGEAGVGVHVLGHPVLQIGRDRAGKLGAVGEGKAESMMVLEIDRQPAEDMPKIEAAVRKVLAEVRAIVGDWTAMREKMVGVADALSARRLPVDEDNRTRRRNSCAGLPPTTSPSSAIASTGSRSRTARTCWRRSRPVAWA